MAHPFPPNRRLSELGTLWNGHAVKGQQNGVMWLVEKKKCKTRSGRKSQEVNSRTSPGGTVDKNLPAHAGDTGSIPGPGGLHVPQGS